MADVQRLPLTPSIVKQPKGFIAKPKPKSKAQSRKLNRQIVVAAIESVVALILVTLSLGHLIRGIEIITGADRFDASLLGAGIDIGFISLELTMLGIASDKLRRELEPIVRFTILGTIVLSAGLNAIAQAEHATGWYLYVAYALGAVIPGILYAVMFVLGKLASDCYKQA